MRGCLNSGFSWQVGQESNLQPAVLEPDSFRPLTAVKAYEPCPNKAQARGNGRRRSLTYVRVGVRFGVISRSPGSLAFFDTERPPMKARGRADEIPALLQGDAASQRRACASSSSSRSAKWRLISTVLVSGPGTKRCSAGWSSGE